MVVKVPHHTVTVHRDGQNIRPPVGKPFDFHPEDVKAIREASFHALRDPVNESTAMSETELLSGKNVPENPDDTRDAGLLARAPSKAGGKSRNQGGSKEEALIGTGQASPNGPNEDDEL